jgi:TolA-binding protein
VLAYDKLNRRDDVLTETNRLVSEYGPAAGWARANANRKAEAGELAETALRELVQDYHQEATKTKNAATYRLARAMYRRYLDAFPSADAAYGVRFYYAEILYALEEWDAAAAEYGKVVEANPGGEHAKKAAYAAVLAAEKSVAARKRQAGVAAAGPEPMSDPEQRLVEACERYVRVAPGAQDEVAVRYRVALLYYEHRLYPEASARFADIVAHWPADPWSQKAADLSLDILNAKEQWAELGELARAFHVDERLAPRGSDFEKRVARIAEGAEFKHALDIHEKRNDPALAARKFRAFVEAHPSSEYAPVALNDCMVIAEAAGQLDIAMAAGAQLLRDHPRAEEALRKAAVRSLASGSARTARYADAARWSEEYAALWPADPKSPDMLFDAAVWREGLDDDASALADWRAWLRRSAGAAEAQKMAFKVGLLLERTRDFRGAVAHWAAFQKTYARGAPAGQLLLARYREALALRQLGRDPAAAFLDVGRRFDALADAERTSAVIDAAAHARFLAVERPFAQFAAIQLDSARERDLVRALKRKHDGLARLLQAYTAVIRTGSAVWSAAALTRLGEAYRDFNKGLLEAPTPKGLDADQRDLYRSTLESQALPLEDKAVEAFAKAADIGLRTGVYSEWVLKAQEQLREYRPDQVGEARAPALVHRVRTAARGGR